MSYGKGYKPDPQGHRRTPLRAIARKLSTTALPASASVEQYAPPVMDQAQTSACTGHATACAIYTALGAAGAKLAWVPSPKGIYTIGREIDLVPDASGNLPALTDDGAEPNQVMRGLNEWGIRAMVPLADRFSDCDPTTINDRPTLAEIEADARTILIGQYACTTADDVALALANKIPVTFSIEADGDAFQSYTGGALAPLGTSLDHYVCFLGYETTSAGRVWTCRNSWSTTWGANGDFQLSEACLAQLGDMVAMKVSLA